MTRPKPLVPLLAAAAGLLLAAAPASAALMDGYTGTFALSPAAAAPSEADVGRTNPSFTYSNVPTYGTITISYGPYFAGQSYSFDPDTQPIPAQTGNTANGPLSLNTADPHLSAIVEDDSDAPGNPVIGGSINGEFTFVGPIAILFSIPVKALELTVGDLSDANQVILEGFAADGSSLGTLMNGIAGYQQFDLSADGGPIAGLSIRSVANGNPLYAGVSGLGIFAAADIAPPPPPPPPPEPTPVPAPGASALALAAAVLAWTRRSGRDRLDRAA